MKARAQFFNEDVFRKLANELWRRYYLNGDCGISIGLGLFKGINTDPLRGLLGITEIAWTKKKRIMVRELEEALKNSAFSWTLIDFITFVTKKDLILKADEEKKSLARFTNFLNRLDYIHPIFTKKLSEKQLSQWFEKGENTITSFKIVAKSLENLPTEYTRIPVFAYEQTGDPHAFDDNRQTGILFLQMLHALSKTPEAARDISAVEEKNQILNEFFLLRDDIMNNVAVQGLIAKNKGMLNEMWHQACLQECSWNVPLKEILQMDTIQAFQSNKVVIVENSSVYSILIELFPHTPMVCSSGQFTYAVWQLLNKLESSNTDMYYVGDLDPEGIVMAQTLIKRFPQHLHTLGMNLKNFQIAARSAEISEQRLKKLRVITNPKLLELANEITKTRQVAMQEGFLNELIAQLKQFRF